ncbi:MAG: hypothetical protein HY909_09670 [Deltaproteobacteria bacterium]|nr:hypothetical protein [Deltaproteobacteria bacterium]
MWRCFLWLPVLLLACTDDHGHGGLDPTCNEIVNRCHALDRGPGTIHDCHQLAEGNNVALCASRRAECLAACVATDAGPGDAADAVSDGGG